MNKPLKPTLPERFIRSTKKKWAKPEILKLMIKGGSDVTTEGAFGVIDS